MYRKKRNVARSALFAATFFFMALGALANPLQQDSAPPAWYLPPRERMELYRRSYFASDSPTEPMVIARWVTKVMANALLSAVRDENERGDVLLQSYLAEVRDPQSHTVILTMAAPPPDSGGLPPRFRLIVNNSRTVAGEIVRNSLAARRIQNGVSSQPVYVVRFPRRDSNGAATIPSLDSTLRIVVEFTTMRARLHATGTELATSLDDL